MKRSKKTFARCPSCGEEKHESEMGIVFKALVKYGKAQYRHYKELELRKYTYGSFVDADFDWACDHCLENKKAIIARPELQEGPHARHLAYSDKTRYCFDCRQDFVFSKNEKQVWYEAYKLPLNSGPSLCLPCRKTKQKAAKENKLLSELLKNPESELNARDPEQVIAIYLSWGKMEKVKYYQSVLRKVMADGR